MAIFVYADESGVFDNKHEQYFVFGGVIFLDKESRDIQQRMYRNAERALGPHAGATADGELKATTLSRVDKGKLFRSLNRVVKFAVVIHLCRIHENIFSDKKTKQRYLDYAFKRGLKKVLKKLIRDGHVSSDYSDSLIVKMDAHTTATNGKYELRESLEQEFKLGTFNATWSAYYPPIFPHLQSVHFELCDSRQDALIRAADIVANRVYFLERKNRHDEACKKINVLSLP